MRQYLPHSVQPDSMLLSYSQKDAGQVNKHKLNISWGSLTWICCIEASSLGNCHRHELSGNDNCMSRHFELTGLFWMPLHLAAVWLEDKKENRSQNP